MPETSTPTTTAALPTSMTLRVGGYTADQLAAVAGATPFFVYDRARIDERIAAVRAALPTAVHVSYAIKANPMPALVAHVARRVDGLDVASAGEMRVALAAGAPAAAISFAGPGKSPDEVRAAVAAGIVVTVESASQLDQVRRAADALSVIPRVCVRINPAFELKGAGMKMAGGAKPFGIDAEDAGPVLRTVRHADIEFDGFHIFAGSQCLSAESIAASQREAFGLALRLVEAHGVVPPRLNLGGGFGIPYFSNERPLDLPAVGGALHTLVRDCAGALPQTRLSLELGRYLVGEAGTYVCRVLDRKVSRGQVFLVTDGGLHHQLAASGNLGAKVVRRNYPISLAGTPPPGDAAPTHIVGRLCTPMDVLGENVMLPPASAGDLIAIHQAGAYGRTASPSRFLGHPEAVELFV